MISRNGKPYSPKSITSYSEHLGMFARWAGDRLLADLEAETVALYSGQLRREGKAAFTVAGRENVIRIWLGWCAERKLIGRSPLADVRRTKAPDPPIETFTAAESRRMLAVCDRQRWDGTRNAAIIMTLWRTGVRADELCALEFDDYDSIERRLTVRHGKGDKFRLVGVPDDADGALQDWIVVARGREPGPLFPSERGDRLQRTSLSRLVAKIGRRAAIADCHPHRFRHTFAVDFLRAGGDSLVLVRLLGHTTLAMTQRYLRALADEQAAAQHVETMRGRAVRRR
jgi:site-specific recombinase XerD